MYGLDYVALRYFNVYGPRMDIHGVYTEVLVRWMERIAAGQPPLILGDGSSRRWTSSTSATSPRANLPRRRSDVTDEVFNVASGTETSLLELAQALLRVMGSDLGRVRARARGQRRHRAGWPTRAAREELGFEAEVDLEEGLAGSSSGGGRARRRLTQPTRPLARAARWRSRHAAALRGDEAEAVAAAIATAGSPGPARGASSRRRSPSGSAPRTAVACATARPRCTSRCTCWRASAPATR